MAIAPPALAVDPDVAGLEEAAVLDVEVEIDPASAVPQRGLDLETQVPA